MSHCVFSFARRFGLTAAACCVACSAFADDDAANLDGVVVTATRTAQPEAQTLAAVSVLTRADIERLQLPSLLDLLQTTPGVAIDNSGGLGKASNVFLRGTEPGHVLVLLDGVKIGSATTGQTAWQDIPLEQIERIEIARGPFSSLYGSEAIGGVIQIFTRRPQAALVPSFSLGSGSYRHDTASAGLGGRGGNGWYSLELSRDRTRGINSCRVGAAEVLAACFADQPDRDGYRNNAATISGGYRFGEQWDADVHLFRSEGHNRYDGSYSDSGVSATQALGGRVHFRPNASLTFTLGLGTSGDFAQDYLGKVWVDRFDTHRELGSAQVDATLGGGLWSAGFDWQHDAIGSADGYGDRYAVDARTNRGTFAQWQQTFGSQSLQASARHDADSQFGDKDTGSMQWGWRFADALRVTASYGTAFKAPTFNDLYYPNYGNPKLRPENSRNLELGLRAAPEWGKWSVSAFQNDITDLIAYDAAIGLPGNIADARIRGAEGGVGTQWLGWLLNASATRLDPRDRTRGLAAGNLLPRRPRDSVDLSADRSFGEFSVGGNWHAAGRRYDDIGNRHPLGSYALLNLHVAYAFAPAWKLQCALENAFGKDYETAWYYNQPGRNFLLVLRYQPSS